MLPPDTGIPPSEVCICLKNVFKNDNPCLIHDTNFSSFSMDDKED